MIRQFARAALHRIGPLHRMLGRYRGTLIHRATPIGLTAVRLGSDYGGWTVIPSLLGKDCIVYAVGVGSDISFDRAMTDRFQCSVYAFDPTPMAREWIERQSLPPGMTFHPVGLAAADGEVAFKLPPVEGWDSFSLLEGEADGAAHVICPVRRLESLMGQLGHSHIDVLKMDIEGFEYQVIEDVLSGSVRPDQWLIEFHHTMYHHQAEETVDAVRRIEMAGYTLFSVSNVGHEYSFVRSALLKH